MATHVEVERIGSRVEIVLARPEKKNAITEDMYAAMAAAVEAAEADPGVRSVVFTGKGPAFTAGNDIDDFIKLPPLAEHAVHRFLRAISAAHKALIAAVEGPAVGIGSTLLLHCDHVVIARSAQLSFAFVKLGLTPEAGSSLLLPRVVGPTRAASLMLSGDPIAAEDAYAWGLATEICADGQALVRAQAFADKLAALPAAALVHAKRLLRSDAASVQARITEENLMFAQRLEGAEFKEAAAAFLEKRPPKFG
jgi:enoyl-CoA hydratase/carnithine racemase